MNNSPVFSVILPVYNGADTIRRTIDNVIRQTYPDYELLIIDDGSSDQTPDILKGYISNPHIRIFRKENGGVSSARNIGLQKANGTYVCFVDADDLVDSEYLNTFQKLMQETEMAICGYTVSDGSAPYTAQYSDHTKILSNTEIIQKALRYRDITSACWNKCFKKEIICQHQITFDESLSIGEDLLFLLQYCMQIASGIQTDSVLYHYIIRDDSAMRDVRTNTFNEKWYSEWDAIKKAEELLSQNNIEIREIQIKKVRIANKLLNMMKRYKVHNPELKKDMKAAVRQNFSAVREKEFTAKQKASILLKILF